MRRALPLLAFAAIASVAPAQLSLSTAVDLALRSNPRVLGAQADVSKATAQIQETHDVYIPTLSAGAGLGQAYGYSEYPPTLFTMSSGSLVFNIAQQSYIRSARAGLKAAQLSLEDTREQVAEDTALAFIALDHDQQRSQAIAQQYGFANSLAAIVQERADAGQDTQTDLIQAKLTQKQLLFKKLTAEDDTAYDREHLARLIGLPPDSLTTDSNFPSAPAEPDQPATAQPGEYANPAVASAFANADARLLQAKGDAKFRYWPTINMVAQYNRYATFTNSFKTLDGLYGNRLTANEEVFGVQIALPLFDKERQDTGHASSDIAARALHDAQQAQIVALDGQARLSHSVSELQAQADIAALQQQLAQLNLEGIQLKLQSGNPDGPQMTPKDELSARIAERDDYLAVVDASFQLHQAEIQLLRQRGQLIDWLASSASSPKSALPASPSPHP
jgi:outer membrane protein TolC